MNPRGRHDPVVYFIQDESDGLVKIGRTTNLESRMSAIRGTYQVTRLSVLGLISGGRSTEAAMHLKFASANCDGEWFNPTPELMAFIAAEAEPYASELPERLPETPAIEKVMVHAQLHPEMRRCLRCLAVMNCETIGETLTRWIVAELPHHGLPVPDGFEVDHCLASTG